MSARNAAAAFGAAVVLGISRKGMLGTPLIIRFQSCLVIDFLELRSCEVFIKHL